MCERKRSSQLSCSNTNVCVPLLRLPFKANSHHETYLLSNYKELHFAIPSKHILLIFCTYSPHLMLSGVWTQLGMNLGKP